MQRDCGSETKMNRCNRNKDAENEDDKFIISIKLEIRSHRENLRMPEECEENDMIEFVERLKDK